MKQGTQRPSAVRIALFFLALTMPVCWAGSFQPSSPGADAEGRFGGRLAEPGRGTAILNADTQASFPSIQAAVDAALPGQTLQVQVAQHVEGQVFIDKDLTLEGMTGTETVLMGVDTGSAGDDRAWFLVDTGIDLTVRNLTFDGNGQLVYQAFRHKGGGLFEGCVFRDIRFNPSTNYQGVAIVAFGGDVTVRQCDFSLIGRIGVLAFGAGLTDSTIESNTFTGKGDGDFLDYAFEAGAGAQVTLRNNIVRDCRGIASVDNSGSGALLVSTFFGPGTRADIFGNTLLDSLNGIAIGFGPDTSEVDARFNRIVGNDNGLDTTSITVTAENNWWGCNAGPGTPGCDTIILDQADARGGGIDADPWLVLALVVAPAAIEVATSADVTADLTGNSDGVVPPGPDHLMDGTEIAFSANGGAVDPPIQATQMGVAQAVYSASAIPGQFQIQATLDNQTVQTPVSVAPLAVPALGRAGFLLLLGALLLTGVVFVRRANRGRKRGRV